MRPTRGGRNTRHRFRRGPSLINETRYRFHGRRTVSRPVL